MSLSVKSVKGVTHIKWTGEMAKGAMTAEWRISPEMDQKEVLDVLLRACSFLATQMGVISQDIKSLETATTSRAPAGGTSGANAEPAGATPPPSPEPYATNVARVPMMPPTSLSDRPNGGPPTNQEFWSGMPTTVPQELTASPMGWEMIPEGED